MHQAVASAPQRRLGIRLTWGALAFIALTTLLPSSQRPTTSALCIVCGDTGSVDVILNLLLFVPLGAGLAFLGLRPWTAAAMVSALSATIETLQLSIIAGRDASVGDVIMNSLGGVIGFALVATSDRWIRPRRATARLLLLAWSIAWLAIQVAASFALMPAMTDSPFYGQHNRANTRFPGTILGATIGGIPVPDHRLEDSSPISTLLAQPSTSMEILVVPNGPTSRPAPIVRIADARRNEIVVMQESRSDLIFSLRTRSVAMRLRPLYFRLRHAFPPRDSTSSDTLRLVAQYGPTHVALSSRSRRRTVATDLRLTPALAWTMVFPFIVYTNGAPIKAILASIWIAALVLPLGYWGRPASRSNVGVAAGSVTWALAVAAVLGLGMWLVPTRYGLDPAALWEWGAAVVGVGVGVGLAVRSRLSDSSAASPLGS